MRLPVVLVVVTATGKDDGGPVDPPGPPVRRRAVIERVVP